jgi:hypothetical protein
MMKNEKWNYITPKVQVPCSDFMCTPQSFLLTQHVGAKKPEFANIDNKPCAFKNLTFEDDQRPGFIPKRSRSGEKKPVEQNINFHFWLSPRESQEISNEGFQSQGSKTNMIKVIINKSSNRMQNS